MLEKNEDYRKARKESKDKITKVIKVWSAREETLHDEGFQNGAEFGYNKANEWHYVKDGDLPKDEEFKWCISDIGNPYVARWSEILNCWEGTMHKEVCCPYAWQEIEFPQFKE